MRKGIAWAFGILFGSALAFAVWSGFNDPDFLMGETTVTTGKIIDVFPSSDVKTFNRRVKYVYAANDKYYYDYKRLGTEDRKQVIGNGIRLIYSIKNPENNRVVKFEDENRNFAIRKFYSKTEKGYWEIKFINGIFKCREFGEKGKLAHSFVGDYSFNQDSIKFNHYHLNPDSLFVSKPKLFIIDPNNVSQFIEVNTQATFREVSYKRR